MAGPERAGNGIGGDAYNKAVKGRQIMAATSSVGPGATNMVTAAAVGSANRLPLLLLVGDTFVSRVPDPVLQQVEVFGEPSTTVNDAFRPVTKYWDRIVHPAQVIQSLPAALSTMLDPATRGPALIALPQDVQATAYDYPTRFFAPTVHEVPRPRADSSEVTRAVEVIRGAERPVIIAGGGVHYSVAESELGLFVEKHNIPVVETMAGKSSLLGDDPSCIGPVGVTGCEAANNLVADADVILAIGTRLGDFTTGSWTVFKNEDAIIVGINTVRFDAVKHRSLPVVGDARETLREVSRSLGDWSADAQSVERAAKEKVAFRGYLDQIGAPSDGLATYAQVVRIVNDLASPEDVCVAAAGGFPGEVNNGWLAKGIGTFDCEYGYSCMGYEIAGGWGAAIAHGPDGGAEDGGEIFVFVGDGSYLMMNSDLYSSVLSGHKMIAVVCDNGGFAVINRLQIGQGGEPFNNLLADCRVAGEVAEVDFVAHAEALGCGTEAISNLSELEGAIERARTSDRTYVIVIKVDPHSWTEGGAFWEVGVPETSNRPSVNEARLKMDARKAAQRIGW